MRVGRVEIDVARRLGAAIRERRRELGLDQSQLALVAGVSTRTVHAIENGKPTAALAATVALLNAVGLELDVAPRRRGARGP